MPESPPSLFARLSLAIATFFRLLGDGRYAQQLEAWSRVGVPALPDAKRNPALRTVEQPPQAVVAAPPMPVARDLSPALQLLSILQREGRLIDFVKQEIAGFSDSDVGAAARVVHAGCRKAFEQTAWLESIRSEPEGAAIVLEAGFDSKSNRLVGAVQGQPPFRGHLRHRGWRLTKLTIEEPLAAADLSIIAPAEVEI